jgi:hypothetical protein
MNSRRLMPNIGASSRFGLSSAVVWTTHGRVIVIAASALRAHSEDRGLISARAPAHGGEIFLGAVGAFAMNL